MIQSTTVWIFKGPKPIPGFPSAVFSSFSLAEDWIKEKQATGTLTEYPLDRGVYDWAIENKYFEPKKDEHISSSFIENFSSASQRHYHYENGELGYDKQDGE